MYSNSFVFMIRCSYFQNAAKLIKNVRASSSTVKPIVVAKKVDDIEVKISDTIDNNDVTKTFEVKRGKNIKSDLVAAAFAPVRAKSYKKPDSIDEAINNATTPEQLLGLVDICKLNRKQTLKIISILAEWAVTGETDMKNFERDPRFTSLCQTLGRPYTPPTIPKTIKNPTDDLTMVLNVKNDDEAAKIITTFTLQQLIKVLSSLAYKKRRSVPLLRSLSFSITQSSTKIDVKQGADVLYALASLNYQDEVLLEKICAELYECLARCKKTSVIGSIATSLGLLRYKDIDLLDSLTEWVNKNIDICRNQDIISVLLTLAHVYHMPNNAEDFFTDVRKRLLGPDQTLNRLDIIWALTILGQATHDDYSSVLNPDFYNKIVSSQPQGLSTSCKKKLLNINGAASLSDGYKGPLLEVNDDFVTTLSRSKEKQILVTSVFEALTNLLPSSIYLRTNINLQMGFSLDGECLVDSKMTPLPLIDRKSGEPLSNTKGIKIGIFIWDYHEFTKGRVGLCGVPTLCQKLATASGYRILAVPYVDFNPKDKLTDRVKYLEKHLKLLVKS